MKSVLGVWNTSFIGSARPSGVLADPYRQVSRLFVSLRVSQVELQIGDVTKLVFITSPFTIIKIYT